MLLLVSLFSSVKMSTPTEPDTASQRPRRSSGIRPPQFHQLALLKEPDIALRQDLLAFLKECVGRGRVMNTVKVTNRSWEAVFCLAKPSLLVLADNDADGAYISDNSHEKVRLCKMYNIRCAVVCGRCLREACGVQERLEAVSIRIGAIKEGGPFERFKGLVESIPRGSPVCMRLHRVHPHRSLNVGKGGELEMKAYKLLLGGSSWISIQILDERLCV
ncbi:hypothetical protein F5Y17DRAFT_439739 [Xylariaceae sp. FL0594]|nr:hypothetical protein F5Y17DRAFT_439739 [Xylariaceae sp. FL0594]